MKAVIQRVTTASVAIDGQIVASINKGLLVFLGVEKGDDESKCMFAARKIAGLRVFEDDAGKMNRSVTDVGGQVLMVSQFTIAGSIDKGRRPSFDNAMAPGEARQLFERVVELMVTDGLQVTSGVFQEYMEVSLVNDGPATFILEK